MENPPKTPKIRYETNEDPNYFWLSIPGTELRVSFDVRELKQKGLAYIDEKAAEIDNYMRVDEQIQPEVIMLRVKIPAKVHTYGGAVLYYIKMGEEQGNINIGSPDHPNIKVFDTIYKQSGGIID